MSPWARHVYTYLFRFIPPPLRSCLLGLQFRNACCSPLLLGTLPMPQ